MEVCPMTQEEVCKEITSSLSKELNNLEWVCTQMRIHPLMAAALHNLIVSMENKIGSKKLRLLILLISRYWVDVKTQRLDCSNTEPYDISSYLNRIEEHPFPEKWMELIE